MQILLNGFSALLRRSDKQEVNRPNASGGYGRTQGPANETLHVR
jgi:hypothetical protein